MIAAHRRYGGSIMRLREERTGLAYFAVRFLEPPVSVGYFTFSPSPPLTRKGRSPGPSLSQMYPIPPSGYLCVGVACFDSPTVAHRSIGGA